MAHRENARARALRAARVVTLGLALAAVPACTGRAETGDDSGVGGSDTGPGEIDSGSTSDSGAVTDASDRADSGRDSGSSSDSGSSPIDSGTIADASNLDAGSAMCPAPTRECCEATGGFWDEASMSCAIPGPFVPPNLVAAASDHRPGAC